MIGQPLENKAEKLITGSSDRQTRDGSAYIHRLGESSAASPPAFIKPKSEPQSASIERRDAVYRDLLLDQLTLTGDHANHLRGPKRRLSDVAIVAGLYASLPTTGAEVFEICRRLSEVHDLYQIPGFYRGGLSGDWKFDIGRFPSFFIPVFDVLGRIAGLQIRSEDGHYFWFSTQIDKPGGALSGSPIHFARPWRARSTGHAIFTEGPLKGNIIAERLDAAVIAAAGAGSFPDSFGHDLRRDLPELRTITLAFDSDWRIKPGVCKAAHRLIPILRSSGFEVRPWVWDAADGKGLDDLLNHQEGNQ